MQLWKNKGTNPSGTIWEEWVCHKRTIVSIYCLCHIKYSIILRGQLSIRDSQLWQSGYCCNIVVKLLYSSLCLLFSLAITNSKGYKYLSNEKKVLSLLIKYFDTFCVHKENLWRLVNSNGTGPKANNECRKHFLSHFLSLYHYFILLCMVYLINAFYFHLLSC